MMEKRNIGINLVTFSILYLIACVLSYRELTLLPAGILLLTALGLYLREYQRSGQLLNLTGLYALGLIGGEGVACLKLSRLSTVWTGETWLSFYLAYALFYAAAAFAQWRQEKRDEKHAAVSKTVSAEADANERMYANKGRGLLWQRSMIQGLLLLSYGCFLLEAWKLGFVPFFTKDMPHAYSTFHLPGVHYFTTLVVLIPAFSVQYLHGKGKMDVTAVLGLVLPFVLTILLVSRFQMMFAAILMVFTYLLSGERLRLWQGAFLAFCLVLLYVLITVLRAHSVSYLNGIFEMKNPDTPIFITQPYMYIANNYDNFNVMTRELTAHSRGLRMLYPLLTLSGLKFFLPLELGFPLFTTKEELTTVTILYDSWYDFGIFGVMLFSLLLGLFAGWLMGQRRGRNPYGLVMQSQVCFYLLFSFFTTWFSNPATWFYLGTSLLLWLLYRALVDKAAYGTYNASI